MADLLSLLETFLTKTLGIHTTATKGVAAVRAGDRAIMTGNFLTGGAFGRTIMTDRGFAMGAIGAAFPAIVPFTTLTGINIIQSYRRPAIFTTGPIPVIQRNKGTLGIVGVQQTVDGQEKIGDAPLFQGLTYLDITFPFTELVMGDMGMGDIAISAGRTGMDGHAAIGNIPIGSMDGVDPQSDLKRAKIKLFQLDGVGNNGYQGIRRLEADLLEFLRQLQQIQGDLAQGWDGVILRHLTDQTFQLITQDRQGLPGTQLDASGRQCPVVLLRLLPEPAVPVPGYDSVADRQQFAAAVAGPGHPAR